MKKVIILGASGTIAKNVILIFLLICANCSTPEKKDQIYKINLSPCGCSRNEFPRYAKIKLLEKGLNDYNKENSIILDDSVEEEIYNKYPDQFLYDVTIFDETLNSDYHKKDLSNSNLNKEYVNTEQKAEGKLNRKKLTEYLSAKNVEKDTIRGYKIYSNEPKRYRGLELIKSFQPSWKKK